MAWPTKTNHRAYPRIYEDPRYFMAFPESAPSKLLDRLRHPTPVGDICQKCNNAFVEGDVGMSLLVEGEETVRAGIHASCLDELMRAPTRLIAVHHLEDDQRPFRSFADVGWAKGDHRKTYLSMYGEEPDSRIVEVDVVATDRKGEEGYWAFWHVTDMGFAPAFVWADRRLTEMCFPNGTAAEEEYGRGKAFPVDIKIVGEATQEEE